MDPQDKPVDQPQIQNNLNISSQGASQAPDSSIIQNPLPSQADDPSQDGQEFTEVSLPPEAEDTDLIEKEWVERAKQIVEHTREDPYEQQRALSQMKADYLKKRYNKDIKVSED